MKSSREKWWHLSPLTAWSLGAGLLVGAKRLENKPTLYLPFGVAGLLLVVYGFGSLKELNAEIKASDSTGSEPPAPLPAAQATRAELDRAKYSFRSPSFLLLTFLLALSGCNTLYAPVRVIPAPWDVFDESVAGHVATPPLPNGYTDVAVGYEAGRKWIGRLGQPADFGGVYAFDKNRYVIREAALILAALLLWTLCRRYPHSFEQAVTWIRETAWLWPFVVYIGLAIRALLFVPCTVVVRRAFERIPERTNDFSLWLWQVDGETVHYGLVAYEEIVLLLRVVAFYGLLYIASIKTRSVIRAFISR
jgi:hypothetical protein